MSSPARGSQSAPAVGLFTNLSGLPIERHLREAGWQTACLHWGDKFDAASFRRFNVIVLSEYPAIKADARSNSNLGVHADYEAHVRALLVDYVQHGGGLLVYGSNDPVDTDRINALLDAWGGRVLNETVEDSRHLYRQTGGMQFEYQYTENIAKHPTTAGVRTLFYPLHSLYGAAVRPLQVDDHWQILVRGMAEACSRPLIRQQQFTVPDRTRVGQYATAPPLVAVREVGQGRVAVFGWSPVQTFFDYGHYMVEDIAFTRGSGERPADGLRLLERTLSHLAEPSRVHPETGYGGPMAQAPLAPVPAPIKPLRWQSRVAGEETGNGARWYRGVLGARTALTGGHGTVAEYATAARAAKLDFIGFMEDFSRLDEASWNRFRAECRAASGPDLLVVPGMAVQRGKAGDWYFKISDFEWLRRDMLTADGRRIENYEFDFFETGLNTQGPFDVGHEPSPYWLSRGYNAFAVTTTRQAQSELDLEAYLSRVEIQDNPKPVAIDLIDSPAEVAAAAKRMANLRLCHTQDELRRTLKDPDAGRPAQISNGPLITTWIADNIWRVTWDRIVPGTERLRLHLRAESDVPLAEAIVYDGTRIFRHFRFSREKTCALTIEAVHDQQRTFTVVVRDSAGRMALRSGLGSQDLATRRFMCGDRQNSLANAYVLDAAGHEVSVNAAFMQMKLLDRSLSFPANPQTVGRVPWYWDGAPGGYVQGGVANLMTPGPKQAPSPEGTETNAISRMAFPLGSRDVICQELDTEAMTPDRPYFEQGFWPVQPLKSYRARTRCFEFRKNPDGPAAMLVEGEYTMLTDGQWEAGDWDWRNFSQIFYTLYGVVDGTCQWALVGADGTRRGGVAPPRSQPANFLTALAPGGYVAYFKPGEAGAVFPLDRPVLVAQELHRENWFRGRIGYGRLGQHYRAGEVIPYRLVVFTGSRSASADTSEIETFRRDFGIGGGPPAYRVQPRVGQVRSTDYVLELEAVNGGFAGRIGAAALATRLPIRVHGVNPNWTAAIVEQGERWWLPIGVLDGAGYAALDTSREHRIWIGNVVSCDQPELRLTLLPDGVGGFSIEAHNPTDRPLTATIRTAAEFNLVRPCEVRTTLAAGTSAIVELK